MPNAPGGAGGKVGTLSEVRHGPRAVDPASTAARTEYTCPMHPEIVRDQRGNCPICGMALEPRKVSVDSANPELTNMTRRFWVAVVLTIPLLAVMVSAMLPGHPLERLLPGRCLGWVEF